MDFQEHFTDSGEVEPYDLEITARGHLARMRKCSRL